MEGGSSEALHTCHEQKSQAIITRVFALSYSLLLIFMIYFRLFPDQTPFIPWLLVFSSELFLSFLSLLNIAYKWRPVTRNVFPARLRSQGEEALPSIDVFVFTADPRREPAVKVMNTVISAMALDYPPEKLAVYISDDGGSPGTLAAAKAAFRFARWWIPFCRKYKVVTRCPSAYFGEEEQEEGGGDVFLQERRVIEERYMEFKEHIERATSDENESVSPSAHDAVIEIINSTLDEEEVEEEESRIPPLIYVSREKRPTHPHNFKAGAVNALLRVSSIITNAPYILVLDCDMYCNDPSSALQAMCFHLDPRISSSLAFVQFPQKFNNLSSKDIYGSRLRLVFDIKWPGMDGLKGPMVSGTCFYMKRRALFASVPIEGVEFVDMKRHFGASNELIKSLQSKNYEMVTNTGVDLSSTLISECHYVASSTYEQNTGWGKKVGFMYGSVLEDYFTGFKLHCDGWNSVFCNPQRPAFLGTATTNLNDSLVQNTRWQSGLLDVTLSRHFPLIYGPSKMSLLQCLCYASLGLQPFCSFPILCLAIVPQLYLIHGVALYPKASSPWFMIFLACFLAPKIKFLVDFLKSGASMQDWWNEERMWFLKSTTSFFFGTVDGVLKKMGLRKASFTPTNKVDGDESVKLYKMGKFNFQASPMFMVPLSFIVLLNLAGLLSGVFRLLVSYGDGAWDGLLAHTLMSVFALSMSYPVIEGMFLRKDKGKISSTVTLVSTLALVWVLLLDLVLLGFK